MSGADPAVGVRRVVIGVGNPFRSDDGVGHRVAELLAEQSPAVPHLEVVASDGEASRLVDTWAGADLAVVVDAVATGSPPGRVDVWDPRCRPLPASGATSTHASGVGEAWALGQALGTLPRRLLVVGIEGACFDDGTQLSGPVADAVPTALGLVRAALEAADEAGPLAPDATSIAASSSEP